MKKLTLASIMILSLSISSAFAAETKSKSKTVKQPQSFERQYGMAGCGLGSMVMGRHGSQTSASTTNTTSGSQVFGITTGTSNCIDSDAEEVAHRMDRFIQVNKVALAEDMARGNGETLQALASIAGCSNLVEFNATLQRNFHSIYPDAKVQFMDVTDSVISTILDNHALKQSCTSIG